MFHFHLNLEDSHRNKNSLDSLINDVLDNIIHSARTTPVARSIEAQREYNRMIAQSSQTNLQTDAIVINCHNCYFLKHGIDQLH